MREFGDGLRRLCAHERQVKVKGKVKGKGARLSPRRSQPQGKNRKTYPEPVTSKSDSRPRGTPHK